MAGLDCDRKLWQLLWDREGAASPVGMSELIMTMGRRFGEQAHQLYPQATLIAVDIFNLQKAVEDTQRAIESGAKYYSFGRTSINNKGLLDFKRRWYTNEEDLNEYISYEKFS